VHIEKVELIEVYRILFYHNCDLMEENIIMMYRVILLVLDPRSCEYLKDYSLNFEHVYMTTYLAS
jgi:ArsR family metal-binding transcriptional regulator